VNFRFNTNEFLLRNLSNQKVVPILYRDDLNSAK